MTLSEDQFKVMNLYGYSHSNDNGQLSTQLKKRLLLKGVQEEKRKRLDSNVRQQKIADREGWKIQLRYEHSKNNCRCGICWHLF